MSTVARFTTNNTVVILLADWWGSDQCEGGDAVPVTAAMGAVVPAVVEVPAAPAARAVETISPPPAPAVA